MHILSQYAHIFSVYWQCTDPSVLPRTDPAKQQELLLQQQIWGGNSWSHINCCHNSLGSTLVSICFCTTTHNEETSLSAPPEGKLWQTRAKQIKNARILLALSSSANGVEITLWHEESTSTHRKEEVADTWAQRPPQKNNNKKNIFGWIWELFASLQSLQNNES